MPPRLYVYKMTSDTGAAPCVDGGNVLTCAICKPKIRSTARVGDLLFGFAANSLSPDNRLIYIARVTGIEVGGDYYDDASYAQRGDRIYIRGEDGRFRIRSDACFHDDGTFLTNDVGAFPEYERARVLVSDDFRYLGSSGASPSVELAPYPNLRALVESLRQGHRVNHSAEVESELWRLQQSAWSENAAKVVGAPTMSPECTTSKRATRSSAPRSCA